MYIHIYIYVILCFLFCCVLVDTTGFHMFGVYAAVIVFHWFQYALFPAEPCRNGKGDAPFFAPAVNGTTEEKNSLNLDTNVRRGGSHRRWNTLKCE